MIFCAYIYGSVPTGYILGKCKGIDVRFVGSGSTGATNAIRALGIRWAVLVAIVDASKGFIFAGVAKYILGFSELYILVIIFSAAIGHVFPVFLKFKGGKGVLAFVGGLLIIGWHPIITPLVFAVWGALLFYTKTMSLTNLVIFFVFVPFVLYYIYSSWVWYLIGIFGIFPFVAFTHRENIKRIIKGKENKLNFKLSPSSRK